jgi:hypothetical protein
MQAHWVGIFPSADSYAFPTLIGLGFEVALSLVSMHEGAIEAEKQATTLSSLNMNMASTAGLTQGVVANTNAQKQALQDLTKEQGAALAALNASAKTMQAMSEALRSQLAIIKDDRSERRANEARRPRLAITLNGQTLSGSIRFIDRTNGTTVFPFWLQNDGDLEATHGVVRISFDPHISFRCDCKTEPWRDYRQLGEPGITVLFDQLRSTESIPITLHAASAVQSNVRFYVSWYSDQNPRETSVAVFTLVRAD